MKRTAYFKPRSAARLVMAAACTLILAAACTTDNDPSRPGDDADDHPVPFTFTAVAPPAMTDANTRAVPGNDEWKGDGTEQIRVRIEDQITGESTTGIYTVISTDGKTAVLPGDEPALWPSRDGSYYVWAWYPALKPGDYNITDQSTPEELRQVDMLRAFTSGNFYNTTPALTFLREMAKVRVELTGVDASVTDIEVGILGPPRFKLTNNGRVNDDYLSPQEYITACRDTKDANTVAFEAMFPPVHDGIQSPLTRQNFIRIRIGDRTYYFTRGAGSPNGLWTGSAYTYTVAIPSGTTSTASAVIPGTKAVIPGLTRDLTPQRTAAAMEGVAVEAVP